MPIIKVHKNDTNFTQVYNSAARDGRLSLDTRGLLTMMLSYPSSFRFSVEVLLEELNRNKPDDEPPIGEKALRRMTTQLRTAGYLEIKSLYDEKTRTYKGKEWHVFGRSKSEPVEVLPPDAEAEAAEPETVTEKTETRTAKYPAAFVFQQIFRVNLDMEAIRHIEDEVGTKNLVMWQKLVKDHWVGMTPEQKESEPYRQKAVKFLLEDLRRERRNTEQAEMRSQYQRSKGSGDIMDPNMQMPAKTFTQYAEKYDYGSPEYLNFRDSWVKRALEKGNEERLAEVEQYEGLRESLARSKKRKGSVAK